MFCPKLWPFTETADPSHLNRKEELAFEKSPVVIQLVLPPRTLLRKEAIKWNYFLLADKLNYTTARTRQIEAGGILQVWPSSSSARTLHSGAAVSSPPEWSWEETALSHWYCKWLKDVWLQISFRKWMMASHSGAVLSSQHFRDRGRWICESLTNLIYLVSSRTTRAVYRPCFKRKRANKTESEPGNTTKIHQYCASYRTPLWGSIPRKSCWACQGRM